MFAQVLTLLLVCQHTGSFKISSKTNLVEPACERNHIWSQTVFLSTVPSTTGEFLQKEHTEVDIEVLDSNDVPHKDR